MRTYGNIHFFTLQTHDSVVCEGGKIQSLCSKCSQSGKERTRNFVGKGNLFVQVGGKLTFDQVLESSVQHFFSLAPSQNKALGWVLGCLGLKC